MTTDRPETYRTKANYEEAIQIISNSHTVDLKATKGVSEYCILNDLEHFNVIENWSADIMHDICEGTAVTLLKHFFGFLISSNVLTEFELKNRLTFFDYGKLNAQFVPSELRLGTDKLNQNASQMKCLMHHIPYLFRFEKDNIKLKEPWSCIKYMLKIIRIVYSNSITELDLADLVKYVSQYLNGMIRCYDLNLKPKDHNMTHYAEIIRRVGPLVHLSTLRYEMKHKELTSIMKNKNNFKNVTKTIAETYQAKNVFRQVYTDQIKHAALKKINPALVLEFAMFTVFESPKIQQTRHVKFNNDYYESGLIIKFNSNYFEIEYVFLLDEDFYFICSKYDRIRFDTFLMSLEIKKYMPIVKQVIKHSDLTYTKSHDKKVVGDKIYILSDSLEIQ